MLMLLRQRARSLLNIHDTIERRACCRAPRCAMFEARRKMALLLRRLCAACLIRCCYFFAERHAVFRHAGDVAMPLIFIAPLPA